MAMDVVRNCTFGIDVDIINNPEFTYFVKIRDLINGFANLNMFMKLTSIILLNNWQNDLNEG